MDPERKVIEAYDVWKEKKNYGKVSMGVVRTTYLIDEQGKEMKKRIAYGIVTFILLAIEVLIALFVHDAFVRPYIGDVLVVVVIYTFVRIFIPERCRLLPLFVFLFAAGVEVLQLFHIVDLLGLGANRFFRVLIGSVFDMKDVLCYAVGCLILGGYEVIRNVYKK